MEGRIPVGEMEGRDSRKRKEELDGYRAKGNMKREPIYFPASLLLFVTSALLYLIELVFLPLESVLLCVLVRYPNTPLSLAVHLIQYTKA
jgi:hypothetical protein